MWKKNYEFIISYSYCFVRDAKYAIGFRKITFRWFSIWLVGDSQAGLGELVNDTFTN